MAVALCVCAASFDIDCSDDGAPASAPSALAVGDTIAVHAPGGASFALRLVSAPPAGIAGQSYIARDEGGSASAVVKLTKTGLRITIDDFMNQRQYTVRCKDGKVAVSESDTSQVDPGECGTCSGHVEQTPAETAAASIRKFSASAKTVASLGNEFGVADQTNIVDILVVFDQGAAARSKSRGFDSIEECAEAAIARMNMVLDCSQLSHLFQYRLAGVTTVNATFKSVDSDVLRQLRASSGVFAKIPALRNKYGADIVTLLINRTEGTTNGIAWGLHSIMDPSVYDIQFPHTDNNACNVCFIDRVLADRYTMSHEVGHNMGCGHSNLQYESNPEPESEPYSFGYHFIDKKGVKRSTVMAYTSTAFDSSWYDPIPYFSSPDITPEEYGVPVGTASNDNRRVLTISNKFVSKWWDRTLPYDYDVRVWENGREILSGNYCDVPSGFYHTFTLTHQNANATIYYTLDGSLPNADSPSVANGGTIQVDLYSEKTLKVCAVLNGVAQSVRTIAMKEGNEWSGTENGNGVWTTNDASVLSWCRGTQAYDKWSTAAFFDNPDNPAPVVTVMGEVAPYAVVFDADKTTYTFKKGDATAMLKFRDSAFAPDADVTFNLPVQLAAAYFTNMPCRAITFNAPFGQTVDSAGGNFSGMVNIGPYGTLTVAPGSGKTQTLEKLNNVGWYAGNSTFRVGEGTVVFNGTINGGAGVTGRTKLEVGNGGNIVFNQGGATGYEMDQTSLTVEKGGSVKFNEMEHLKRTLYLDGGTIYAKRFDLMRNPGVYVTDDSAIENNGGGYILIRYSDSVINVSDGKTLTLGIGSQTDNRTDTSGWGMVKRGGGTIVANGELKHSGVTDIEEGTIEVGYSSGATVYGTGWIVASNSTLRVRSGCTLKVPSLTLDPTATVSIPAASSAPLVVSGNVDLTEVSILLNGADDLSLGASYPLISATGEMSGLKSFVREAWPRPAKGLGWKVAAANGVLTASVVNAVDADPWLDFITNIPELKPSIPDDATMTADGGLKIASSPVVVGGLTKNAVGVTLDVVLDEPKAEERTICSWLIGSHVVRCVVTNGVVDCFYDGNSHVANSKPFVALSSGRHLINIGYKSLSDDTYGGTFVYVDGTLAYRAAGLRWSSDNITNVTVGATAGSTPDKPYNGLVINNLAVLNASSSSPLPNMTSSGGTVEYDYFAGKPPCVFALTPNGGFETYGAILSGAFSGTYDALSVSVVASFPENATGTIVGSAVLEGYYGYSTQVEYRGNGVFAFRDNGSSSLIASVQVSADMSVRHLYTMTYTKGVGYKLYMDGAEVLTNDSYYKGGNLPLINRVLFGCGYWTNWMTSYNDNPNPMPNLKVYASHIALGTDDRTASETAVIEATGYEPEPQPPETPATVDILVAYDNGARAYVENRGRTLEEFAQAQIDKMNAALATNRLERFYAYSLAGVCRVDGTYTDIDAAPALAASGEGAMVSLRAAREIHGADTVTLLVDTSGATIGNSSPLSSTNNVAGQHECAFSVCSISAVDTGKQHTMLHENAHNMGCGHARAQSSINSPFEYGRGYYFQDGNVTRHTIMAYGGDNDASWYFSTSSSRLGFKLGDETNDNARVLRETCGAVSQWREGAAVTLDGSFATGDAVWQTCAKYPWSVDGATIRSYNQTDYTYQCTTPLKATVVGPKRLTFSHKSYFGGKSLAGNNYSHFDVLLDDSPVLTQTECTNEWTQAQVDIPDGTHEITFVFSQRFAMNNSQDYKDGIPEADDAVWLKDITVAEVPQPPEGSFIVPGTSSWIEENDPRLQEWLEDANFELEYGYDMTWQDFMFVEGANGYVNWMNYVLGLPAADPTAKIKAKISFDAEGRVVVSVADSIPDAPTVQGLKVVCTLLETGDLKSWPDTGVSADGKVVVVTRTHTGRFYRVEVSVASQ